MDGLVGTAEAGEAATNQDVLQQNQAATNQDVLQQNQAALLQQTGEHVHLMMENLFLHNNNWKDKHMVTSWQCGMGVKGW